MIDNLLNILILFCLVFIACFALYLPLLAATKNKRIALKYAIPFSVSIQIIFGYFFYLAGEIKFFPYFYLLFLLVSNIIALKKVGVKTIRLKPNIGIIVWTILVIPLLYTVFYFALTNLAPGHPDTYFHIYFLNDIKSYKYISQAFYAPGFHILTYPISLLIKDNILYRFSGPVVGSFVILSIFLLFKDKLKNNISRYLLLFIFCLPVFGLLILQVVGFWPSSISFIFFSSFIALLSNSEELRTREKYTLYGIFTFALSLSVPYLYVQYIPILILFVLFNLFLKKDYSYKKCLFRYLLISIIGFCISYTHVYLLTQVINKNGTFPQIPFVTEENNILVTKIGRDNITITGDSYISMLERKIVENKVFEANVLPLIGAGQDILSLKGFVPFGRQSIKTYGWILLSIFLATFFWIKKDRFGFTIFFFCSFYGLPNISGILELDSYRGRAAWYFILLAMIGIVYLFDLCYQAKYKNLVIVIFLVFCGWSFYSPPMYMKYLCTEIFSEVRDIINRYPDQDLIFYTDNYQINLLSKKVSTIPLDNKTFIDFPENKYVFVVFEKRYCDSAPNNIKNALSNNKGFQLLEQDTAKKHRLQQQQIEKIQNNQNFNNFKLFWENEDYSIYKLSR